MRSLLLALGLLAVGCAPPSPQATWRFLDHGNEVRRRWPEGVSRRPPVDLRVSRLSPSKRFRLYEVQMPASRTNGEARVALLAPAGSHYELAAQLPPNPELHLGLGYLQAPGAPPDELTFRVSVRPVDEPAVSVLEEKVAIEAEGAWRDRIVPLDRWQGRQVFLRLATSGGESWGAWEPPEIVSRDNHPTGWSVVLISLDTLRADHLSCYGYHRETSPNLDALAARGIRFATAVSQSPWTRPAHLALFTGLYPVSSGDLDSPRLAEVLWRNGYRTGALTGGGQVHRKLGFMAGFETYRVYDWLRDPEPVLRWLENGDERPGFLFLHTYETHDPYTDRRFAAAMPSGQLGAVFSKQIWWGRRDLSREEQAYVEALYDGDIAFTDARLGELFHGLEERGLLERTVIVVTSDHGEQFWEHGSWRHGATIYDHQLLVPLIVYLPPGLQARAAGQRGSASTVIEQQLSLVDLYPTLLDLLGVEMSHAVEGRSVLPLIAGREMEPRKAFAENTNIRTWERKALRTERYKFIQNYPKKSNQGAQGYSELFDLVRDPGEQDNLVEHYPEVAARLFAEIETMRGNDDRLAEELPTDIDPDLRRELEALGYVGID